MIRGWWIKVNCDQDQKRKLPVPNRSTPLTENDLRRVKEALRPPGAGAGGLCASPRGVKATAAHREG